MATRPAKYSDDSLIKATGKPWREWLKVFDKMGAKNLSHKEIANRLYEEHGVPGWWAQMLTVQFELAIETWRAYWKALVAKLKASASG